MFIIRRLPNRAKEAILTRVVGGGSLKPAGRPARQPPATRDDDNEYVNYKTWPEWRVIIALRAAPLQWPG